MILLPRFFASKIKRILMYLFNFSFPERLVKVIKRLWQSTIEDCRRGMENRIKSSTLKLEVKEG